jgi:hypothetical protein
MMWNDKIVIFRGTIKLVDLNPEKKLTNQLFDERIKQNRLNAIILIMNVVDNDKKNI